MADGTASAGGRPKTRKTPSGVPVMTNRAALRVLYDLAGKKTWYMLGNELGFRVEDINKKNYPWPSDFGCHEYCAKFQEYAKSEHTSSYAALIAVRESLIESNAYTPEVKALVDNVRPDTDEAACEAALRRLMETIIETALPYNKVPKPVCQADESGKAATLGAGATAQAGNGVCVPPLQPGGEDVALKPSAGVGASHRAPAEGIGQSVSPCGAAEREHEAARSVSVVASTTTASAAPCSWPSPEAFLFDGRSAEQAFRTILPADVFALVFPDGAPVQPYADALAAKSDAPVRAGGTAVAPQALVNRLCSDCGLACRAMQRACSALAAVPGVDSAALFAQMDAAFGDARQSAASADAHAFSRACTLYLHYSDGDAGRALFCCTLLYLLGPQGFTRVMTCPATHELFER